MSREIFDTPLVEDDKELAKEIRKLSAKLIRDLLLRSEYDIVPEEKALRDEILKRLAPNMVVKAQPDELLEDDEIILSEKEEEDLLKLLRQ